MYEDLRLPYQQSTLPSLKLGGIIVENQLIADAPVYLLLKSFNRHGLIAGATGSGKTKTIQVLSEQLSLAGVPSLVMDIKGDISGLAMPGEANDKLLTRAHSLNIEYTPRSFPTEFLTLGESHNGLTLRSTVMRRKKAVLLFFLSLPKKKIFLSLPWRMLRVYYNIYKRMQVKTRQQKVLAAWPLHP